MSRENVEKNVDTPKAGWPARIYGLRKLKLGLSQTKFAARLGLTVTTISGWESGRVEPSGEHYIKMGNIAPDVATRWEFWERGGLDMSLLGDTAEFSKRRPAQSKKPKADSPSASW